MEMTFFHKVILTLLLAFAFACLIQFYRLVVERGAESLTDGQQSRAGAMARP